MRRVSAVLLVAVVVGVGVQSACAGDRVEQFPTGQTLVVPAPGAAWFRVPEAAALRPGVEPFHIPASVVTAPVTPAPIAGWSSTSTPAVIASATPAPTAAPPPAPPPVVTASATPVATAAPTRVSTPAVTASTTPAPTATPSPASTPAATVSATPAPTAAPTRTREPDTGSRGPGSRAPRSEVPGLIPVPALGNPEAECEALADTYTAAHQFYRAGTVTSSTAWNDYLTAHNSGQVSQARVSRLQQSYERLSANLDRSLATMAASEQAAHELEVQQRGRCDLAQVAGKRYLPLPPPSG